MPTYESLADPALKGLVCSRSGAHPQILSLVVALIAHGGEAATEAWARGVVGNLREAPEGGDTDQAKSVAAGECAVAVSNIYCRARLMASERVEECNLTKRIGVVWPNQAGHGTRIDFSGGGMVRTSPHPATAIAFLEYLVSDEAQRFLANANNELPAVPGVEIDNVELEKLGQFSADTLPVASQADNPLEAQKLLDRAGYRQVSTPAVSRPLQRGVVSVSWSGCCWQAVKRKAGESHSASLNLKSALH